MGLFKSSGERQLDAIILRLEMNMSNNYKDNACDNLKELVSFFEGLRDSGKLKGKALTKYEGLINTYSERLKGFTHKDQKPYWH